MASNASVPGLVPLIGRILIVSLFIPSGLGKLTGFSGAMGYVASAGLPMPAVAVVIAIVVEVLVGLALLLGWRARWAALIMALFTLAAAFSFHEFWAAPPEQQMMQSIQFYKNMAIAGGLLFVLAFGPGKFSLGAENRRVATDVSVDNIAAP